MTSLTQAQLERLWHDHLNGRDDPDYTFNTISGDATILNSQTLGGWQRNAAGIWEIIPVPRTRHSPEET